MRANGPVALRSGSFRGLEQIGEADPVEHFGLDAPAWGLYRDRVCAAPSSRARTSASPVRVACTPCTRRSVPSRYAIEPPQGGRFCNELVDGEIVIHPRSPNEVIAEFLLDTDGLFRAISP